MNVTNRMCSFRHFFSPRYILSFCALALICLHTSPAFADCPAATTCTLPSVIPPNYTGNLGSVTNATGTIADNGSITFLGGNSTNTFLNITGNVALNGSGTLTLNSGNNNGFVFVQQSGGSFTLTNGINAIQGYGIIGNGALTLANLAAGVVNANASGGTLTLNGSGGVTNAGLLTASSGGILQLSTGVANTGGNITAATTGGTVNFSSTVTGGTLNSLGTGALQTFGAATLSGVTLSTGSTYTGGLGTSTTLTNSLVNNGALVLNGGNSTNTYLNIGSDVSLSGGGSVTLNSGNNNGAANIQQTAGSFTLTNVDNTIKGYGNVGNGSLTIVNQASGTLNANASGSTLILNGGGITNTGLLEATNGGTLQISTTVLNAGGNITSNGGTVDILSNIRGGTLNGTGLLTISSAALDGSTNGALTLASGAVYTSGLGTTTNISGSIVNNGTIGLVGGNGTNTYLQIAGNTTLSGGGTVTLNSNNNNGAANIQQTGSSFTLTNADNTIRGYGNLGNGGLTFVNQSAGVVNANVSGQSLNVNGSGGVTNTGLLEATGGGTLTISNTVNNSGGNITSNGGTVNILSGTIQGGTLNGAGLTTTGTANLDGVTNGALTLASGSVYTAGLSTTTNIAGSIVNNGAINIAGGNGTNSFLQIAANTTLTGGGTVSLNSNNNVGFATIQQTGGTFTLTNANNTIQGSGVLGNGGLTFVNQSSGVVNANSSGSILYLNGSGGVTNTGLLEATGGGTLQISNVVNNAGGNITANGGTVNILGTIQGGTLNGAGFTTSSSGTLDGTTHGALTLASGSVYTGGLSTITNINGSIVNNGTLAITGGNGTNTYLQITGNTTLSGAGTVTLNSNNNVGAANVQQSGGSFTLTNGNTIQGYGAVGNGGLTVVNANAGTLLANVAGQTLLLNGTGGLTNNGTMQANAGATLHSTQGFTNFASNTLTGGTYNVFSSVGSQGTVQIDALGSTGGEIQNNNATIMLSGTGSTIRDSLGKDALSDFRSNQSAGSFSIFAGANINTLGPFSNAGMMDIGQADTFSVNGGSSAYTQSAGTTQVDGTLTASSTTISGGLLKGTGAVNGPLLVQTGGTVNPGDSPGTLTVNGIYTNAPTGNLIIELAGTSAGNFDVLNVNGLANFGGTLDLLAINGFTLNAGQAFFIVNYLSRSGTFGTVDTSGLHLSPGLTASLLYDQGTLGHQVELLIGGTQSTPEPGTWLMLAGGLGLLVGLPTFKKARARREASAKASRA